MIVDKDLPAKSYHNKYVPGMKNEHIKVLGTHYVSDYRNKLLESFVQVKGRHRAHSITDSAVQGVRSLFQLFVLGISLDMFAGISVR